MKKGFTLIELLVYVGIFAVVSGLMVGIMTTMLRINQRESSSAEATSQLNFVMQTIQRLTRESSAIIVNSSSTNVDTDDTIGSQQTRLVLRMKDSGGAPSTDRDPIIIYAENNAIKMSEGSGAYQRTSDLTNSRVLADNLKFTKYTQYPGQDTVAVDIQLTYNSQSIDSRVSRTLRTAIARVSAATFDSNLLPGTDNQYEIGYSANQRWKNISISNLLNLGQSLSDPIGAQNGSIYYNTNLNKFKGYASSSWASLGEWNASGTAIYYNEGNVGIGMAKPMGDASGGPAPKMQVESNFAGGGPTIVVENQNPAGDVAIDFRSGNRELKGNIAYVVSTANPRFIVNQGFWGLNTVLNEAGGNVGIGTTTPATLFSVATTTNIFNVLSSGNVGIGTTAFPVDAGGLTILGHATITPNKYFIDLKRTDQIEAGGGIRWRGSNDSILFQIAGQGAGTPGIYFKEGTTDIMTIRSGGNVGIGTATPSGQLHIAGGYSGNPGNLQLNIQRLDGNETFGGLRWLNSAGTKIWGVETNTYAGQGIEFNEGSTNRMYIALGGNVGIGETNPLQKLVVYGNGDGNSGITVKSPYGFRSAYFASDGSLNFNNGTNVGFLNSAAAWIDGSDIAYKTDIVDMFKYGLSTVMQMKPREYKMKDTNISQIGFIAQEIETIVPEVVSGQEGNKGISYGQLTAVLTKAIQEQQKQIEELKAENNSLKSRIEKLESGK